MGGYNYSIKRGDFSWALMELRSGKKVRRADWDSPRHARYVFIDDPNTPGAASLLLRWDDSAQSWQPNGTDLLWSTWELVD